mmetsp:Transcript_65779/g.104787  ORF Transcript_65779/g.104787 Transcript_65779/m.104787 type:complete len:170 (+) Transcript_65779:53-562(+)
MSTAQQQQAVKTILSDISISNDSQWDILKAELRRYQTHLVQQQPQHQQQAQQQQRPTKPPLTKNANSGVRGSQNASHNQMNFRQSSSGISNHSLQRPIKPPMRLKSNTSHSPMLRLFIRVPLQKSSTRKEIVIWNKDKMEMEEAINKFCNEINNNKYKDDIRNTILALI